jgi:hypothetical protein
MDKLSTELDSKIAKCLAGDTQALRAFSKVNKYCQVVAEPYLYKDVVFHPDDDVTLKRLLLTLLRRKEFALHISSVRLDENLRSLPITDAKRTSLNNDVWAHTSAVFDVTKDDSGFNRPRSYTFHWLYHIVQDYELDFDNSAAFILCMATNLQQIHIDASDWSRCR